MRRSHDRPVRVTCAHDAQRHLVPDAAFARPDGTSSGRLLAVCGHTVLAASLTTPPGRDCALCLAVEALADPPRRPGGAFARWIASPLRRGGLAGR